MTLTWFRDRKSYSSQLWTNAQLAGFGPPRWTTVVGATSAQIDRMTSELDGLIGKDGTLVKFTEETQAMLRAADLPATSKLTREAANDSRLASDDLRRSLPAIRDSLEQMRELARLLEDQPESVIYGPRPAGAKHP